MKVLAQLAMYVKRQYHFYRWDLLKYIVWNLRNYALKLEKNQVKHFPKKVEACSLNEKQIGLPVHLVTFWVYCNYFSTGIDRVCAFNSINPVQTPYFTPCLISFQNGIFCPEKVFWGISYQVQALYLQFTCYFSMLSKINNRWEDKWGSTNGYWERRHKRHGCTTHR